MERYSYKILRRVLPSKKQSELEMEGIDGDNTDAARQVYVA